MHQRNDALRALPFFSPQHAAIRVAHTWQPIRHVDLDSDYDGQQPCCLALLWSTHHVDLHCEVLANHVDLDCDGQQPCCLALRRWTQHVDLHCKVFANHVDLDRDGQQTMLPWTAVVNTPRWLAGQSNKPCRQVLWWSTPVKLTCIWTKKAVQTCMFITKRIHVDAKLTCWVKLCCLKSDIPHIFKNGHQINISMAKLTTSTN